MLKVRHKSDCALHNAPAYGPKPCDCGGEKAMIDNIEMVIKRGNELLEAIEKGLLLAVPISNFKVWLEIFKNTDQEKPNDQS